MSVYVKRDNKGKKRSDTPTDLRICDFIYKIVSDKYNPNKILDPCAGDRRLTKQFVKLNNTEVINYEIKEGTDFLKETNKIDCDLVLCNPPFNLNGTGKKLSVEVFMDKIIELVDKDTPIILITPMGFRLNQKIKSKRWRKVRDDYPPITSIISLPLDIFEDTLFHCEILCFNCFELLPHYFLPI